MKAETFALPQVQEKPHYVQELFGRIAASYDLMNDVMTFGLHRLWKRRALRLINLQPGEHLLDVCCGTGDLALYMNRLSSDVHVTGLDFCDAMLDIARKRTKNIGISTQFVQGDALHLPFIDNQFDGAIISYGLRNVADYEQCLKEMFRVIKPGSRLVILDMSHPKGIMDHLSSFYRFTLMPLLARCVAKESEAYRYLSNSIFFYLTQEALANLMQQIGLNAVRFENKLGGICAIHWGTKA